MDDKRVAVSGGIWMSVATGVTMLAQFLRIIILTRFLAKSDFGVVSITNMVIGLCVTFTDLGFASVILYKKELTEKEFSSLFWCQFVFFSVIFVAIWLCSPLVSNFYEVEELTQIIPMAALSIIFQAIGKLYESVLQKKFQFRALAVRTIVSNVISLVLAVYLAMRGYGVYSMVLSALSQALIINVWNLISGFNFIKIKFFFSFSEVKPLIKIGIYQTFTRIVDYLATKLDVMIMGKLLGTEALGVYDLAKELVFKIIDFIRSIVSKVGLPILSSHNDEPELVKSQFLKMTKGVAYLCIPICVTIAVFSKYIVRILYGETFVEAAPVVAIFSLMAIITSISSFFDMLGIAKGRTDLNFKNTIYRIILSTPIIIVTSLISSFAVATGQLFVSILLVFVFWNVVVMKTYPMSLKVYLEQFSRLLLVLLVAGFCFYVFDNTILLTLIDNWILRLVILAGMYVVAIAAISLSFKNDLRYFYSMFKGSR